MNITKKVCIYILVGLITITGTFTSFYKGVYAFEYVGGALAFEEAIKWLLASVGIISAGGMTADYWEQHGDEFVDYCTEQNITDTEVANWQLKLCEGTLDKGSACWQAFKDWASTLTGSSSGGSSGNINFYSASGLCNYFNTGLPYNYAINQNVLDFNDTVYASCLWKYNNIYVLNLFLDNGVYSFNSNNIVTCNGNSNIKFVEVHCAFSSSSEWVLQSVRTGSNGCSYYSFDFANQNGTSFCVGFNGVNEGTTSRVFLDTQEINPSDSDFLSVQQDVTDLDVISSPIPDTDAQEVAIPMPGVSDSDNDASADAYDNIVDQVNDGTLELDDAITQVIDTLKIIVYEQETDKIFPKPDNQEDQEDLDDKINQNKDNMGFTLGGLETVFPFCIPWDIYAFMSLLRADPVPPKVELPFPNPLHPNDPWIVEVDFADWDDGMRIVRLAEDFLFIIGLALLTRSLIGAGGGDG